MNIGNMDRRVSFYRPASLDDGYALVPGAPALLGTVWASKADVSDAERQRSGAIAAEITARFVVRWSSLTAGVTPADSLVCEGRTYDIVGIKEQGRRVALEISARARVA